MTSPPEPQPEAGSHSAPRTLIEEARRHQLRRRRMTAGSLIAFLLVGGLVAGIIGSGYGGNVGSVRPSAATSSGPNAKHAPYPHPIPKSPSPSTTDVSISQKVEAAHAASQNAAAAAQQVYGQQFKQTQDQAAAAAAAAKAAQQTAFRSKSG